MVFPNVAFNIPKIMFAYGRLLDDLDSSLNQSESLGLFF